MKIQIDQSGRVTVLRLSGRITIGKGDVALRESFSERLEAGDRWFLFDMTDVSYVDSAGVGETVACFKRAGERGAVVKVLLSAGSRAFETFIMTCLDRVFEIFHDEDEALASFPR